MEVAIPSQADIWKRNRKERRVPSFAQDAVQHIENAIDSSPLSRNSGKYSSEQSL